MLMRIHRASFRHWVHPGQAMQITATIKASTQAAGSADARISVGGADVAEAELYFSFVPLTRLTTGYVDEVLQRYLARHAEGPAGARE
jgi:hypothetical protein